MNTERALQDSDAGRLDMNTERALHDSDARKVTYEHKEGTLG